jgi:hypothetical protein
MITNGAAMTARLFPLQLVDLGFPDDPVLWHTALGISSFAVGAIALRMVEARIEGAGAAQRIYGLACLVGTLGLAVLAFAPDALIGSLGVLLVSGVSFNVNRMVSVIWVNRRTSSDMRATVHSFLSQAESIGEILGGFSLATLARAAGISAVLVVAGALIALVSAMVARPQARR